MHLPQSFPCKQIGPCPLHLRGCCYIFIHPCQGNAKRRKASFAGRQELLIAREDGLVKVFFELSSQILAIRLFLPSLHKRKSQAISLRTFRKMSTRFLVFALFLAWAIAAVHQAHSLETDKVRKRQKMRLPHQLVKTI